MSIHDIKSAFSEIYDFKKEDWKEVLRIYREIVKAIENLEKNEKDMGILRIYILSAGRIFLMTYTGNIEINIAEKALEASNKYLEQYPLDSEVNKMYLCLSNFTYKYEQSYKKALELFCFGDKANKEIALEYLSLPDYCAEGLMSKVEYEKYENLYKANMLT